MARQGVRSLRPTRPARAGLSFGQTALRPPDTGRPPRLCTLARSAGVTRRILARQRTRRTETHIVVAVRRRIVVAVGRAHVRRMIVERAATQHTARGPHRSAASWVRRRRSCGMLPAGRSWRSVPRAVSQCSFLVEVECRQHGTEALAFTGLFGGTRPAGRKRPAYTRQAR
jgi:hypothetical protein